MPPAGTPRPPIPRIAAEGYPVVAGGALATALTALVAPRLAVVPLALTTASAYFFRDPERVVPVGAQQLVAAADGVITRVDTIDEQRFLRCRALRAVTFLSLFDVHINRAPAGGRVVYQEHVPGAFRAAWDAEADQVNERNYIGLETPHGPLLLIQVAGLVARRIVSRIRCGDELQTGQRIGMIKFGSRTDVIVPEGTARALVVPGMRVQAGITPIGEWL